MSDYDTSTQSRGPVALPHSNDAGDAGRMPPPPASGPMIEDRTVWLPVKGDVSDRANHFKAAYPGFMFEMWLNYPQRLEADLLNNDPDSDARASRVRSVLKQIVLQHNGWRIRDRETGEAVAVPPPTTDAFWDVIPNELATGMLLLIIDAASKLPNSMIGQRRSSARG